MNIWQRILTSTFSAVLALAVFPGSQDGMGSPAMNQPDTRPSLIPAPRSWQPAGGAFPQGDLRRIVVTDGGQDLAAKAEKAAARLEAFLGWDLPVQVAGPGDLPGGSLVFRHEPDLGNEQYELRITGSGLELTAATGPGFQHGVTTLIQLALGESSLLPTGIIHDEPRFRWRGLLLDCGRHFMPVSKIKEVLDQLALYKFNVFHWHLTEDQGWRLEIPGYSRLTEIGAWRTAADGSRYGGFYTADDVREIVAYAAARSITVVPEIEMPGHCQAALAAYPELSCTGGPFEVQTQWGIHEDVFCAGREETFAFLEDVLTYVMDLFPGPYLHIGGDEVPKNRWESCPRCQDRIRNEGLHGEEGLQSWFIARIAAFLEDNGRRLIGWDEILSGGLPGDPAAYTVQAWRGMDQAAAAARTGHDVIVSPTSHAYFDYDPGVLDLQQVFTFQPVPPGLDKEDAGRILGGQMNLWTEYIPPERVDAMLLPRMCAMAEALWTGSDDADFAGFLARLDGQAGVWDHLDVQPGAAARPLVWSGRFDLPTGSHQLDVSLDPRLSGALSDHPHNVHFVILEEPFPGNFDPETMPEDQALPAITPAVSLMPGTLEIPAAERPVTTRLAVAQLFVGNNPYGAPTLLEVSSHAAVGSPVSFAHQPSERYPGGGPMGLTDGLHGSRFFQDGLWMGFEGRDLDATVDLEKERDARLLSVRFLQDVNAWVFLPREVQVFVSADGKTWHQAGTVGHQVSDMVQEKLIHKFQVDLPATPTRFVRILARNAGVCPDWHPGRGQPTWLFADEIVVLRGQPD